MLLKCLIIAALTSLFGCKELGSEWRKVPTPIVLQGDTVKIRVVYATNARLVRLSPVQIKIMLESARATVKQNFGVNIEFTDVAESSVEQIFSLLPEKIKALRQSSIYDFKAGTGDTRKLAQGIYQTLIEQGTSLEEALAYVKPYVPNAHAKNLKAFSETLTSVMLDRLQDWRNVKAIDGTPVLDSSPYNEITYWDVLGYGNLQYDSIITNQLFASAEYDGPDIHTAIRGGVTVGLTTYSRNSKFGTYIVYSTFPFQDNSALTTQLRGNDTYTETESAQLAGAYLAHEIGHMLFQFGHPFGQKSCVMNPVSMLRFREWAHQINGSDCPIGGRAEMKRGAVTEYFNVNWLPLLAPANNLELKEK